MLLTQWLVLIAAMVEFVRCGPQCTTYKNCASCSDSKLCDASCGEVGGVKTCLCKCYHQCSQNSDCPSAPAIEGRSPECSADGCRAYFGGSNAAKCPDQQYPCVTKNSASKAIYFYKKCTTDVDCEMGWQGCKADCKPQCYVAYKDNRFCACVCPGAIKQCTSYDSCATCSYKTSCIRSCQEVDGVKTCFCQCYYPCAGSTCPASPISDKAAKCSTTSGTVGCYLEYGNKGSGCPTADYRCDTYKKSPNGRVVTIKGIFFYKKCEMDSECAAILTNCVELVGEGCVPKCNVDYNNKKFCTCLCPGTPS